MFWGDGDQCSKQICRYFDPQIASCVSTGTTRKAASILDNVNIYRNGTELAHVSVMHGVWHLGWNEQDGPERESPRVTQQSLPAEEAWRPTPFAQTGSWHLPLASLALSVDCKDGYQKR